MIIRHTILELYKTADGELQRVTNLVVLNPCHEDLVLDMVLLEDVPDGLSGDLLEKCEMLRPKYGHKFVAGHRTCETKRFRLARGSGCKKSSVLLKKVLLNFAILVGALPVLQLI